MASLRETALAGRIMKVVLTIPIVNGSPINGAAGATLKAANAGKMMIMKLPVPIPANVNGKMGRGQDGVNRIGVLLKIVWE